MTGRACALLCLIVTAASLQPHAVSGEVGGGGSASTDCFVTYDSPAATPVLKPKRIKCADQDATCGDTDTRLGYCTYPVQIILNSTNFPPCAPADLPIGGFFIPYSGNMNDDHPKHIPDFEPFQNFVVSKLELTPADTNITSPPQDVKIPMRIGFTSKGPVFKTTALKLHPTMCTAPLGANHKCSSGASKDVDTFKLTCLPALDTNGDKISACTGITNTFQQIQEHIFDRKCSTLAGCHGSAQAPHDLCLKSSCNDGADDPYTALVSHIPNNFPANSDGLLRVDPASPANSLLVHKINGGAQLNSANPVFAPGIGVYGLRMPYNNPAIDRARPKLSAAEIQLITDWIQNGALQTGFQSTAKGACQ